MRISASSEAIGGTWDLTFDMSGRPKGAKRPLGRRLDGGVRFQLLLQLELHERLDPYTAVGRWTPQRLKPPTSYGSERFCYELVRRAAQWLHVARTSVVMDTSKAKTQLSWTPRYTSAQTLEALAAAL